MLAVKILSDAFVKKNVRQSKPAIPMLHNYYSLGVKFFRCYTNPFTFF